MEDEKPTTRKDSPAMRVYALPEEREKVEINAKRAGRSVSSYLLALGLGYEIRGVVDAEQVRELARINGDMGRMGGLLKLWLTNKERTRQVSENEIREVLHKVEAAQEEMAEIMTRIVRPRRGEPVNKNFSG